MEDTTHNRNKLLAQYWGQNVAVQAGITTFVGTNCYIGTGIDYLELKSLDDISDRDAYGVGILVNCWSWRERKMEFFEDDDMRDTHIQGGKIFANAVGKEFGGGMSHPFADNSTDIISAIDFLRTKGYAMPFNNCTIEQQIEYGWIKIK